MLAVSMKENDRCHISLWSLANQVQPNGSIDLKTVVNILAWSPNGAILAAACDNHSVQLWDASDRRLTRTLTGHKRGVTAVAFSTDGRTIASGDGRTIKLWHAATGREMLTLYRDIKLGDPLRLLAFTGDGSRLLAADEGGRVQIFLAPPLDQTDGPGSTGLISGNVP
jgi:WD40 repeat protein